MEAAVVRMRSVSWAVGMFAAVVGAAGIASDALWFAALGDRIVHGDLPRAIPYATA